MSISKATKSKAGSKRQAVVVLGMHRSGTSAMAGVLEHLGCTAPVSQIFKGDQNPKGFFESKRIARHNDSVLSSAGSNWHDWRPLNPKWIDSATAQSLASDAVTILREEFGNAPLIVIKDPRMCRMVEYWTLVLEKAEIEPLFVNIHRNPVEVTQSLHKRNNFDSSFGMLLWLRHILDAEAATRGQARFFTSFELLLQNWAGVATRAQDTLDLVFPRMSETSALEIDNFLSRDLRHYVEPSEQLISNPMISDWVRKSYEIIDRWARRGVEENVDYADLDQQRAHFNSATLTFSRFALVGEKAIQDNRVIKAERDTANQRIGQLSNDVKQISDRLDTVTSERDRLGHELDQLTSALRQREAEIDDAEKKAKEHQHDIDKLTDTLRQREAELKSRLCELGELARLLTDTETSLANETATHAAEMGKKSALVNQLRTEVDLLNENLRKRKAEAARNAAHARDAWEDREAILTSTSWRITAPLRRIVNLFRGT